MGVVHNHAKLSSIGKQKLMEYRTMLEAAEKEGDVMHQGDAITATKGVDPARPAHDLDNTAGDSTKTDQKQLGQLIKSMFGQLSSGNPVKMIVDIKNPEVMIGNNEFNTGSHKTRPGHLADDTDDEPSDYDKKLDAGKFPEYCSRVTKDTTVCTGPRMDRYFYDTTSGKCKVVWGCWLNDRNVNDTKNFNIGTEWACKAECMQPGICCNAQQETTADSDGCCCRYCHNCECCETVA